MPSREDLLRLGASRRRSAYPLASAVLILGLASSLAVARWLAQQARETDEARFHRLVRQDTEALRDRFQRYESALQGLADYTAALPNLTRAEWRFRLRLLWPEEKYPGLLEIGLVQTTAQNRPGAIAEPSAPELLHTNEVRLLQSWVHDPGTVDLDLLADAQFVRAVCKVEQTGQPTGVYDHVLSALVNDRPASGFLILLPARVTPNEGSRHALSQAKGASAAPHSPGDQVHGVVYGGIVPMMLLEYLFGTAPHEVDLDLFHGLVPTQETWLNRRGMTPPSLRAGFSPYLHTNAALSFADQQWTAVFHTTALFETESSRNRPRVALAVGCVLTALIAALLFIQVRARLRQEAIAAELRSTCEALQHVQNEREQVSRDLHDGAIQSLYGLQLSLGHYERLRRQDGTAAATVFERCRLAVDALIAELRTFIVEQAPPDEDAKLSIDPAASLQTLVQRFQSASSIPIEFTRPMGLSLRLPFEAQVHLRQVAQEALSNSLRHGHPRHVKLDLLKIDGHLRLRVADDGEGFDPSQAHAHGRGLANMQGRAVQLGGALHVVSRPGHGTQVTLDMPFETETSNHHV